MIRGGLWWFVVVQCISVSLKNRCCLSDVSAATGVVVHGGLLHLCHLVLKLNKIKCCPSL